MGWAEDQWQPQERTGEVLLDGRVVMRFQATVGQDDSYERAQMAAERLNRAVADGARARDFGIRARSNTYQIYAQQDVVAEVVVGDTIGTGMNVRILAEDWQRNIRDILAYNPRARATARQGQWTDNGSQWQGQTGEVLLDGRVVMRFLATVGQDEPYARAKAAASALNRVLDGGARARDFGVQERSGIYQIYAAQYVVAEVVAGDARNTGSSASALAQDWQRSIQDILTANSRARATARQGQWNDMRPMMDPKQQSY
jgi:hypothetical protein